MRKGGIRPNAGSEILFYNCHLLQSKVFDGNGIQNQHMNVHE